MKKAILACDGRSFPKGAFEFIKELHQKEPLFVAGVFLHALNFEIVLTDMYAVTPVPIEEFLEEEHEQYEKNIEDFQNACGRNVIEYTVHKENRDWRIKDLVRESRFADFIAVSENFFRDDFYSREPNSALRQIMRNAECPVLVFPDNYIETEGAIIAYDGSKSAACALKDYSRIFPELHDKPVKIVCIQEDAVAEIPDMAYLEEYAGRHFSDLTFENLHFNKKEFFGTWLKEQKNELLVCGSYSHSGLSDAFHENFAEEVIRSQSNAVFISHH